MLESRSILHPMARFTVRRAELHDAEAVGALLRDLWTHAGPDAPGYAGTTDEIIDELTRPEEVRRRIEGPGRRLYLGGDDDGWIGFSATRQVDAKTCELAGILILERGTRRGLGILLLDAAVAGARDDGFDRMIVRTETGNERALGFYEASGFVRSGELVEEIDGTEVPVVELTMEL